MGTYTIDLVHTVDGQHVLTAYDADGPAYSLVGGELAEPEDGERLESLDEVRCDLAGLRARMRELLSDGIVIED
jgi:hypothetical protein